MAYARRERIPGVGSKDTLLKELLTMYTKIQCQTLWQMSFCAESLLSKCVYRGTQNQNEIINGLIWQRATKETHSSLPTVQTTTFLGVAHFNDRSMSLLSVLKQLGIVPGVHCMKACRKLDGDRIRHSRRKSGEFAKKRRKQLRKWKKKGHIDSLEANEGPSYVPGAF